MLPSLDRALQKLQEIHMEEESYLRSRYVDYMNIKSNSFQDNKDLNQIYHLQQLSFDSSSSQEPPKHLTSRYRNNQKCNQLY